MNSAIQWKLFILVQLEKWFDLILLLASMCVVMPYLVLWTAKNRVGVRKEIITSNQTKQSKLPFFPLPLSPTSIAQSVVRLQIGSCSIYNNTGKLNANLLVNQNWCCFRYSQFSNVYVRLFHYLNANEREYEVNQKREKKAHKHRKCLPLKWLHKIVNTNARQGVHSNIFDRGSNRKCKHDWIRKCKRTQEIKIGLCQNILRLQSIKVCVCVRWRLTGCKVQLWITW